MKQHLFSLTVGSVLALAAVVSHAQTTSAGGTPANVGVSQGTANETASKAVPRNDTGTLVRTSPSAADKAKAAADNTSTGASMTSAGQTTQQSSVPSDAAPARRARKADRN